MSYPAQRFAFLLSDLYTILTLASTIIISLFQYCDSQWVGTAVPDWLDLFVKENYMHGQISPILVALWTLSNIWICKRLKAELADNCKGAHVNHSSISLCIFSYVISLPRPP